MHHGGMPLFLPKCLNRRRWQEHLNKHLSPSGKVDASMSPDKLTRHSQNSFRRFRYFSTVHAFLPSHFVYTTQLPLYPLEISLPDTLFWNVLKNSHKKESRYYWCFKYRGHVYILQIGLNKKEQIELYKIIDEYNVSQMLLRKASLNKMLDT